MVLVQSESNGKWFAWICGQCAFKIRRLYLLLEILGSVHPTIVPTQKTISNINARVIENDQNKKTISTVAKFWNAKRIRSPRTISARIPIAFLLVTKDFLCSITDLWMERRKSSLPWTPRWRLSLAREKKFGPGSLSRNTGCPPPLALTSNRQKFLNGGNILYYFHLRP